jgi:nucleoid DNA-binding protein
LEVYSENRAEKTGRNISKNTTIKFTHIPAFKPAKVL